MDDDDPLDQFAVKVWLNSSDQDFNFHEEHWLLASPCSLRA